MINFDIVIVNKIIVWNKINNIIYILYPMMPISEKSYKIWINIKF